MRYLICLTIFSKMFFSSYSFCEENANTISNIHEIAELTSPSLEDEVTEKTLPSEIEPIATPSSSPLTDNTFLYVTTPESIPIKEESYSLKDMEGIPLDRKLLALLNKHNGIFIEVGAHDGISQSNTFLLEKTYGWSGILIEPSKCLYETLQANRPQAKCFGCALGSFAEDNTYVYGDFHGTLMDSVSGKRLDDLNSDDILHKSEPTYVLMRSLQSILDEENLHHIDFFSLDTEGYEYNILKGIDYSRTSFDYLLIEIYTWDYDRICTLLKDNGYDLVECFSNYDHRSSDWDGTHNDYLFKRNGS